VLGLLVVACARPAPEPFTRETVVAELRPRFPGVSLPSDELPRGIVAREGIVYASPAGHALELDVYRPESLSARPAVLIVHGGGWERGHRSMERPLAKRMAGLGYVAVPVSYRLGPEGRFPSALHDLKAAVRYLRASAQRYGIDPERIGALGGSSGGHLVALLGATNGNAELEGGGSHPGIPSTVQAVVDIDGLADFTGPALLAKEAKNPGAPVRFLGGSYAARTSVWRNASPVAHVGKQSAPTLFINSMAPTPILPGRLEMQTKLLALGIDSETVTMPDAPHPFWLVNPWFEPTLAAAHRFLSAKLGK
jgi:acetyl esterase/lipase